MTRNAVIVALVAVLALSIAGVVAQTQRTATVQVRIWEDVENPSVQLVSHRPEGGQWSTAQPLPELYDGFVQAGRYRYRHAFVNATVPEPLPPTIELLDVACEDHGHERNAHLILEGSLRNAGEATIREVVITAALVDEDGVEVLRATDDIAGEDSGDAIAPGGVRPFAVTFFRAPGVTGTCPVVSIEYRAAVHYESPLP